jgi:tetratricopeptide (TPR) repeat protein
VIYRLLGRAYLLGQKYPDAADIFLRLLSSVPDDFTAQLGLALLREDEGKVDAAIWHLERAYEVKPASDVVKAELTRLYDMKNSDQQKVQLSRAALGRMYLAGRCYDQAIAELQVARKENPQHLEILVLLAEAFEQAGSREEAILTSQEVLSKLPYSLEANRILFQAAQQEGNPELALPYRQRLQELDPYWAYVTPAVPDPAQVPDHAVELEKMKQ